MSSPIFADLAEVEARLVKARHVLVCLDVEKILPPADETTARVADPWRRQLQSLGTHPRITVAIISSRNRAELQAQIGIPGLVYAGNLGLEISGDGFLFVETAATGYSTDLSELGARLASKLAKIPDAVVEDKGLTIRIRAPEAEAHGDGEEVRRLIHETLAGSNHPYHLDNRDKIYEIRPRVPWTKANAVAWITERLEKPGATVIYVSDDAKDEETVRALAEAITIKVDGPVETLANYRLNGLAEVRTFLNWLERTSW